MRRIVRGVLWVVKGGLLVIALAALVVWPLSYRSIGILSISRWTLRPDNVETCCDFGWVYGRMIVSVYDEKYPGRERPLVPQGWQWKTGSYVRSGWEEHSYETSWGPLRWHSATMRITGMTGTVRDARMSCWLLSLMAGAWPLTSLTLLLRRRARRRRLARTGCCKNCGYDLRATPQASGKKLPRCPECGTPADPASSA